MQLFKVLIPFLFFLFAYSRAESQHQHEVDSNIFLLQMDTMMQNMNAVEMKNSADVDFIAMMIPHHDGALKMAEYEVKHGKNFEMIQLAKSIIADQTNEIIQMQLWLRDDSILNKENTGSEYMNPLMETMDIMMKNLPQASTLNDTDMAFAAVMMPHHQAALNMAKVELQYGKNKAALRIAQSIISSQQVEIEQMKNYLSQQADK